MTFAKKTFTFGSTGPKELLEQELKMCLIPDPNTGETVFFTGLCVLRDAESESEKIGNGMAQILQNDSNSRCRLLVRDRHDLDSPILNCYILYDIQENSSISYKFDAINYAKPVMKKTFIIELTNSITANQFAEEYVKAISINTELIKK